MNAYTRLDLIIMSRMRVVRRRKEAMFPPPRFIRIPLRSCPIIRNPLAFAMRETKLERITRNFNELFVN